MWQSGRPAVQRRIGESSHVYRRSPLAALERIASLTLVKALAAFFLLSSALPATAQPTLYVTEDRTIANGNPVTGNGVVVVGRDRQDKNFFEVDADLVNFSGGVDAYNDSNVTLHSGRSVFLYVRDDSKATVAGGEITSALISYNRSSLFVTGGKIENINSRNTSNATITGGSVHNAITSDDNSIVHLSGAVTAGLAFSQAQSTMNISGGDFLYAGGQERRFATSAGLQKPGLCSATNPVMSTSRAERSHKVFLQSQPALRR